MAVDGAAVQAAVELRFGQVGVATAFLRSADAAILRSELQQRLATAPTLFSRAPLVLDLSRLPDLPNSDTTLALLQAVRDAGMLPVGLAYGTAQNARLAETLGLPLFAKFRQQAERPASVATEQVPDAASGNAPSALHHARPVRSGQQIYARQRDLVVGAAVGSGAEAVADGSIHVYGRLGGRALAGARGDTGARIYCREFHAELISIAGHYRVLEDVPVALHGKPVQAWLEGERLVLAEL